MVDNAILHEQKLRLSTENKALHAILNKVEAGKIIDGVSTYESKHMLDHASEFNEYSFSCTNSSDNRV